jgi:hypothetical protein
MDVDCFPNDDSQLGVITETQGAFCEDMAGISYVTSNASAYSQLSLPSVLQWTQKGRHGDRTLRETGSNFDKVQESDG